MQKRYLIFIIILSFGTQLFAQDVAVAYATRYILSAEKMPMSTDVLKKMNAFERPRTYYYHQGQSMYRWDKIEQPFVVAEDGRRFNATQKRLPVFYKDFSANEMYIVDVKNDSTTAAKVSMDKLPNWKILRNNKVILGHLCRKAVGEFDGVSVEAWFATDIDIMDGPEIYYGLPGLILELKKGIAVTCAVSIEFVEPNLNDLKLPSFQHIITYKEYLKRRKKYGLGY